MHELRPSALTSVGTISIVYTMRIMKHMDTGIRAHPATTRIRKELAESGRGLVGVSGVRWGLGVYTMGIMKYIYTSAPSHH